MLLVLEGTGITAAAWFGLRRAVALLVFRFTARLGFCTINCLVTIIYSLAFLANFLLKHSCFQLGLFVGVLALSLARLGNQSLALTHAIALTTPTLQLASDVAIPNVVLKVCLLLLVRDSAGQGEKLHQIDAFDLSSQRSLEVPLYFGAISRGGARGRAELGYAFLDLLHELVVLVKEFRVLFYTRTGLGEVREVRLLVAEVLN